MRTFINLLLLPFFILGQELEVSLPTRSSLKPIYVSNLHSQDHDWRFAEELRSVLEFDLNQGGFCSVVARRNEWEETFSYPDPRIRFNPSFWKKEKISFCISWQIEQNQIELTAFNVEKGTSKRYPPIPLDRKAIHQLSDLLHKDLFGKQGIASLRLIYSQRHKNQTEKGLDFLSEIWVCDYDGINARQVTAERSYCLSPYFIPDRPDEFFYVSERSGQSKIYRASLSNPKGELLVDLRGNQALACLSKKGTQMAFISDLAGRPDLFVQQFDSKGKMVGKARQLYSAPRATQATPTFSPDGKKVAFVSDKDGPPRIYLLDVLSPKDTRRTRPQLLTKKNRENTSPCWSPDGTKLAYSAKVEGVRQIWIYDFATEEETQLTFGPQNKENPSWASNSFHLVYNTECEESCELFLTHLNQSEPIQISKGSGQKRFASWEHLPSR